MTRQAFRLYGYAAAIFDTETKKSCFMAGDSAKLLLREINKARNAAKSRRVRTSERFAHFTPEAIETELVQTTLDQHDPLMEFCPGTIDPLTGEYILWDHRDRQVV